MSMSQHEYNDITQHELEAMRTEFNLADAHTRQSQSPAQRSIVESLPSLWYEAEQTPQHVIEDRFTQSFFRSQRQTVAASTPTMLVYASSIAMVITANFLVNRKMSVSLVEPCFDNIHDIMVNMEVPIGPPLKEEWLHDSDEIYDHLLSNVKEDAIFIVEPNNPTGFTLEGTTIDVSLRKNSYAELIRFAKDHHKLLIFDFCFSAFLLQDASPASFDVYDELEKSGVSYIIIEDTGKIWPLQDTKVAMLKTSKDLHDDIYNLHTSYLLNVSPFVLNLVTQYIKASEADQFATVFELLDRNREIARRALKGSILELVEPMANVSVAWCRITNSDLTATEIQKQVQHFGVYVLPGNFFFWSNPARGDGYIRIALARDTDYFVAAMNKLRDALNTLAQ